MDGVDKSFQQKQGAPESIAGKQTEQPPQPMDDCQAEEIARRKDEVENVRRKVEEAMRTAGAQKRMKWKAEVDKRVAEEVKAAGLEARAKDAESKAEAAEREAEAARVVVLETELGLEKAAASEVAREACATAKSARSEADNATLWAANAARKATWPWV